MPIYEFRCRACGERFEALVDTGTASVECRECGAPDSRRVLSAPAPSPALVKSGADTRRQEGRNAQLRERTKADFAAKRRGGREAGKDKPA